MKMSFPVVVVDTPLFVCKLDSAGEIVLTEVSSYNLLFTGRAVGTCIRIVTFAHLDDFAREVCASFVQIRESLRTETDTIEKLWSELR